jgi:hypothetical protein
MRSTLKLQFLERPLGNRLKQELSGVGAEN